MANLIEDLPGERQAEAAARLDGREDLVIWRSECNALLLLDDGGDLFVCCGGFYDGWKGTAAEFIERYAGEEDCHV